MQVLLKGGVDVEAQNRWGDTALMCTGREGYSDIVQVLLDAGADKETVNHGGDTALVCANRDGRTEVVQALIEAGAYNNTALVCTRRDGSIVLPEVHNIAMIYDGLWLGSAKAAGDRQWLENVGITHILNTTKMGQVKSYFDGKDLAVMCGSDGAGFDLSIDFVPPAAPGAQSWAVQAGGQTLPLLATDEAIELALFVDHTVVEAFFMRGRLAMTSHFPQGLLQPGNNSQQSVEIFATGGPGARVLNASMWAVSDIWDPATHGRPHQKPGAS